MTFRDILSKMAHPKSAEATQLYLDSNPFLDMKINDTKILNELEGRHPCPICNKSRKYFCYTCYVPIEELSGRIPVIKLPIKIDIIKHRQEIDGKSTAVHAAVLAPYDVKIYTYPNIPNYDENEKVVLIFPSSNAKSIQQLIKSRNHNCRGIYEEKIYPSGNKRTLMTEFNKNIEKCNQCSELLASLPVDRAVFIDSTWQQSRGIYKDERIKKLPSVVIQNRVSQFWRHQKGSPRWYLATIEAIHQFLIEIHVNVWGVYPDYGGIKHCFSSDFLEEIVIINSDAAYNGQYDNILFFFKQMYDLIHTYYDHDQLLSYKRPLT